MATDNYAALIEADEVKGEWERDKKRYQKYLASKYTKSGLKMVAAATVNHFTFSVGGAIFEAPALYKTAHHIDRLKLISTDDRRLPCSCVQVEPNPMSCGSHAEYALAQKERKLKNAAIGVVPLAGTVNAIKNKIHWAMKSDRGGNRELRARLLHKSGRSGCLKAKAVVAELLGDYEDHTSVKLMLTLLEDQDGWKILKSKLSAT